SRKLGVPGGNACCSPGRRCAAAALGAAVWYSCSPRPFRCLIVPACLVQSHTPEISDARLVRHRHGPVRAGAGLVPRPGPAARDGRGGGVADRAAGGGGGGAAGGGFRSEEHTTELQS